MLTASVVVPTFNRSSLLAQVLAALVSQDYEGDYEIVIVDDGSGDDTPQILEQWARRHPDRIRVFRQENSGPAKARNRGAREARGSFVAFTDDDCIADKSWLSSLWAALERNPVAAVAGAVINPDEGWVGRYINRESVIDHVLSSDGSVAQMITGNCGVRAQVFRDLGGFDEEIRVAGCEDTEFGVRLVASGRRILYVPEARVRHESRPNVHEYLRMIFRHGRGRRRMGERFSGYRFNFPYLRLLWLAWPLRAWMLRDFIRYRAVGVPVVEAERYVVLRYLENLARIAGYIRGT